MNKAFDEVFDDVTRLGTKVKTDEYRDSGTHIIIDQGQGQIAGYTDLEKGLFTDVPAIVFGDHTRIIKYVEKPFFLGADGVKVFRSKDDNANYKYLYYALKHVDIPNTGYNRHFKWLKESHIPYPSYTKQKQIVEVLDLVVDIMDKRRKELSALDDLAKSQFMEMFGDIPQCEYVTMQDVCSLITDGTHQPPEFIDNGIPFLLVSNVTSNELSYDTEKFISEETYAQLMKRTPIEVGDVLLSTVGSYGHPAIVKSDKRFSFQRHIAFLKPKRHILNSIFLHSAILSSDMQEQIEAKVNGVAQKTLNLSEIKTLRLPLPQIERQKAFSAIVQQLDKSKIAIRKSLDELQLLYDSLMQEYFG